ncbi:penicillin-binding protein [Deinococcus lacus]|uniref:Penicillin-binding protein n=1 Tax=Deinococcus lacus TaxID=392561 RepID=A0ABW1YBF9_9DEIO
MRRAPLLSLLLCLSLPHSAGAAVRLGDPLPPHPWHSAERELVVVYAHGCGDLGELWTAVQQTGIPVRAVSADAQAPVPPGIPDWRGPQAAAFAHSLRVGEYPALLLVRGGRVLNAWEGVTAARSLLTP